MKNKQKENKSENKAEGYNQCITGTLPFTPTGKWVPALDDEIWNLVTNVSLSGRNPTKITKSGTLTTPKCTQAILGGSGTAILNKVWDDIIVHKGGNVITISWNAGFGGETETYYWNEDYKMYIKPYKEGQYTTDLQSEGLELGEKFHYILAFEQVEGNLYKLIGSIADQFNLECEYETELIESTQEAFEYNSECSLEAFGHQNPVGSPEPEKGGINKSLIIGLLCVILILFINKKNKKNKK